MSKAEDLAKDFLKKLVSHTTLYKGTIDELEVYEPYDVIWAYKEGYHQAEKDNELTVEDIVHIIETYNELEFSREYTTVTFNDTCKEVLKRFKEQKDEDTD